MSADSAFAAVLPMPGTIAETAVCRSRALRSSAGAATVSPTAPTLHNLTSPGLFSTTEKPLLGINTILASALSPKAASRLEKYELQSVSKALLPKERVRMCMRYPIPGRGVELWHAPAVGAAHYAGLMVCGSVWVCPVCAAKIAERRREELAAAIASCRASGGQVAMLTYTFRHAPSDTLSASLTRFLAAQRALTGSRPYTRLTRSYGLIGIAKALELTYGANGWHPHAHTLLFLPHEVDPVALAAELYPLWQSAALRRGLTMTRRRGLDLTPGNHDALDAYVAKWGHQPTRRLWSVEDELTRAHSKRGRTGEDGTKGATPFDLLRWVAETGESLPRDLYREYAGVMKGRQQLTWTPDLRKLLGLGAEKTDEDLAGETRENADLLALLTPAEWRAVRLADRRAELLNVADSGDPAVVRGFLDDLTGGGVA